MAITRATASSLIQGQPKSKNVLAGNAAILPGSYESIQTVTVGSGGSSSISFTSIPSTYKHLQIRHLFTVDTNDRVYRMRFNSDSGSNYAFHELAGNGSSVTTYASTSSTGIDGGYNYTASGFSTSYLGPGVIDILDYSSTSKYKTTRALDGIDFNGSGRVTLHSGLWQSTSAISSITLIPFTNGSFVQHSSFALYGIRG